MTKLSVIVPFYNVVDLARDTLRGLATNASEGTEFLLVDDCSTDGTSRILDAWARGRHDTTVIRHPENRGIARARNSGIDAAKGEYLTFLDGDDWYRPGYLAELVGAIERLGCDFVRTDHVRVEGLERTAVRAPGAPRGWVLNPRDVITPADSETMVDYPFVWAAIYRRGLFADGGMRFDENLRTAEDRLFTWRLHLTAKTFAVAGLLGVFYRRGVTTSLTQIGDVRQLDFLPAHDALLEMVGDDAEAERFLPKAVRTYCAMIAFHVMTAGRYEAHAGRRLKRMAADALGRMPQDILERTLLDMNHERSRVLRKLRRRAGTAARTGG
ncbi:glycosyltransferase family 2 protein [Phytomonospora endophytica]|uniref:Glycosyltransferase involved in cell wall biosynthesis n=1 Tax=Phytomonospora endophytica TaxID=714109 RepID=A0A841FL74_9ACTN|nr:glycosyltransferase family 2 protein [Phytomonospora endophytica]MBB6035673.1 glycosyltransferase involved in cell wall biosynthesis [Phytomonospora endophytica]GIG69650.1 glycosyl transferase [Phytomonospora endophytica]